jgi:SAM-dependent methyltransferase
MTEPKKRTISDIEQLWSETGITEPAAVEYFSFHRKRFAFLLRTLESLIHPGARVLDIGLSPLTRILPLRFPRITQSTLGYEDRRYAMPGERTHFHCDLNDPQFPWTTVGTFDVIILAEVIEHLYTPPQRILRSLRTLLEPGGYLVIQTPNAASLVKRIKILCGENPYEMIREDPYNPGHFREYTIRELRALARTADFGVSSVSTANYFKPAGIQEQVYGWVCNLLPPTFRDGITIVLKAL